MLGVFFAEDSLLTWSLPINAQAVVQDGDDGVDFRPKARFTSLRSSRDQGPSVRHRQFRSFAHCTTKTETMNALLKEKIPKSLHLAWFVTEVYLRLHDLGKIKGRTLSGANIPILLESR